MTKKGVSPLIATILLISFVIILAILILFWYFNVISEETEKTDITEQQACATQVEFSVSQVCYSGTSVFFKVQNNGLVGVSRFKVIVTDETTGATQSYETSEGVAVAERKQLSIDPTINVDKIGITPFIMVGSGIYCDEKTAEITNILAC